MKEATNWRLLPVGPSGDVRAPKSLQEVMKKGERAPIWAVLSLWLQDAAIERKLTRKTIDVYFHHLVSFCLVFGHLDVGSVQKSHLKEWKELIAKRQQKDPKTGYVWKWRDYTRREAMRAVKEALAWAREVGIMKGNAPQSKPTTEVPVVKNVEEQASAMKVRKPSKMDMESHPDYRPVLPVTKAAVWLGVCEQTIRNYYRERTLDGYMAGRKLLIFVDSLVAFQNKSKQQPLTQAPEPAPQPYIPVTTTRRHRGMPDYDRHFR